MTDGTGQGDPGSPLPVTASASLATHAGRIRPLLGDRGVATLVDHHPICAACGTTIEPTGPEGWRHVPTGRRFNRRSRWLAAPTLKELHALGSYEAFTARYASQVRADLGVAFGTSESQWREALQRLEDYHARLARTRRARTLPPGENPCLELFRVLTAPPCPLGLVQVLNLSERRRELAALFSWAIPTDEALKVLAAHAPLVEGGAGVGYWSALAQARGVDVLAYDRRPPGTRAANAFHARHPPWTRIHRGSSVTAVRRHRDRVLLLCWPPYEDDGASYAALRAYAGDVLLYVGEPGEGATGSLRFHRELELNWTLTDEVVLPRWPRLRDSLLVYRRNPIRRRHLTRDRCFGCQRFIRTGAIGRCDWCFAHRPTALALRVGQHRVEYPQDELEALPEALRKALEQSPNRIR